MIVWAWILSDLGTPSPYRTMRLEAIHSICRVEWIMQKKRMRKTRHGWRICWIELIIRNKLKSIWQNTKCQNCLKTERFVPYGTIRKRSGASLLLRWLVCWQINQISSTPETTRKCWNIKKKKSEMSRLQIVTNWNYAQVMARVIKLIWRAEA